MTGSSEFYYYFCFTHLAIKGRLFPRSSVFEVSPFGSQPSKRRGWSLFHFAAPLCTRLTGIDFMRMINVLTLRRLNVQKKWAWCLDDHASADILLCKLCS